MNSVYALLDPFDRTNGNGSSDWAEDTLDGESIFDNEWGSQAATTFRVDDTDANGNDISPKKQKRMKRLYKRHNGKGDPDRDVQIGKSYIENDMEMFMSVLELPSKQRAEVREIVETTDIEANNFGGKCYEKVLLTICSLVTDKALSNQHDPCFDERLIFRDEFRELMQSVSMSSTEHRNIRVKIRDKSEYF